MLDHHSITGIWKPSFILSESAQVLRVLWANTARSRNLRLSAIHAFMHFVAQQAPEVLALTARVLAIPVKRFERPLLGYLSHPEIQAILNAPPATTASGRRDRLLFELMYNTGARVSEIAALNRQDIQRSWELGELVHGFGIEQEETE